MKLEHILIRFKGARKQASGSGPLYTWLLDLRLESFDMNNQAMLSSLLLIIKWVSWNLDDLLTIIYFVTQSIFL